MSYQVIYMPPWLGKLFHWILILVKHAKIPYYILNHVEISRKTLTMQVYPTLKYHVNVRWMLDESLNQRSEPFINKMRMK